jgi:hypothetical protein
MAFQWWKGSACPVASCVRFSSFHSGPDSLSLSLPQSRHWKVYWIDRQPDYGRKNRKLCHSTIYSTSFFLSSFSSYLLIDYGSRPKDSSSRPWSWCL